MDWTGYGDSTRTGDKKYVLASFRADANLGWLVDLRSFLQLPELKYRDYSPRKHQVASNPRIQANLNRGLSEAELTIVDSERYKLQAWAELLDRGAEPGGDFDLGTINQMAADELLRESPFGVTTERMDFGLPADGTLLGRPSYSDTLEELPAFDPTELRRRAGGKLRDAEVLAARAHSMMSPSEFLELRIIVRFPTGRANFPRNIERIKKLGHVFDTEHAKSVPLLNGLVGQMAEASGVPRHYADQIVSSQPIRETSSTSSDHIQAADFAAGWAADLLVSTNNDYRALAQKVRWVGLNGIAVPA